MEPPAKRPDPSERPAFDDRTSPRAEGAQRAPSRGAPPTFAAYAMRKDVAVRVSVQPVGTEAEELREDGYGHGV